VFVNEPHIVVYVETLIGPKYTYTSSSLNFVNPNYLAVQSRGDKGIAYAACTPLL
jgi:hypothetical protein